MDRANVYYCANLDSSDCSFDFFFYSVYWFYEKGEKGAITLSKETDRLLVGITEEESAIERKTITRPRVDSPRPSSRLLMQQTNSFKGIQSLSISTRSRTYRRNLTSLVRRSLGHVPWLGTLCHVDTLQAFSKFLPRRTRRTSFDWMRHTPIARRGGNFRVRPTKSPHMNRSVRSIIQWLKVTQQSH